MVDRPIQPDYTQLLVIPHSKQGNNFGKAKPCNVMETGRDPGCETSLPLLLTWAGSRWKKLLTLFVLFLFVSSLLVIAGRCWAEFAMAETFVVWRQEETSKVGFPALTVCSKRQYKEERLREAGVLSTRSYAVEGDWLGDGQTAAATLYQEAVIPVEEIVSDLKVFLNKPTLEGQTVIRLAPGGRFCGETLFHPKEHFYFGRCHSLVVPRCLQEHSVTEVVLTLEEAADVYVHHQEAFFSPDTKAKLSVLPGQATKVMITHGLEEEAGPCIAESFDQCLTTALTNLLVKQVNCSVPWVAGAPICTDEDDRKRAAQLFQENRKNQHGLCFPPCISTTLQFGPVGTETVLGGGRAVLFFPSRVKIGRRRQLYNGTSLTADLTGLVAMLSVLAFAGFKAATSRNLVSRTGWLPSIANVEAARQTEGQGAQIGGKHGLGGNVIAESE